MTSDRVSYISAMQGACTVVTSTSTVLDEYEYEYE